MNAKNPKFAIAPKSKYNNGLISGKKYAITKFNITSFSIKFSDTEELFCLVNGCSHMRNGKNWILRNK